jgi:hypothetical protein
MGLGIALGGSYGAPDGESGPGKQNRSLWFALPIYFSHHFGRPTRQLIA